jgi:hypothetical protein
MYLPLNVNCELVIYYEVTSQLQVKLELSLQ